MKTPRSLTDDLLLLAHGASRGRLRLAVRAAAHADGDSTTPRRARRSLVARGLASSTGRRAWTPSPEADVDALRERVFLVLWQPRRATDRDLDLVALLLAAGALSGRQRMHARTLLARVHVDSAPSGIAWLLKRYPVSTTAELADLLLRETSPREALPDGALDPGASDGTWSV